MVSPCSACLCLSTPLRGGRQPKNILDDSHSSLYSPIRLHQMMVELEVSSFEMAIRAVKDSGHGLPAELRLPLDHVGEP